MILIQFRFLKANLFYINRLVLMSLNKLNVFLSLIQAFWNCPINFNLKQYVDKPSTMKHLILQNIANNLNCFANKYALPKFFRDFSI